MIKLLCVGAGGFIGACLRYMVSIGASRAFGTRFPYGTLIVNIAGGLVIGFLMELSLTTDLVPENMRLFLVTGLLGALTTFSTFSYETMGYFEEGSYLLGLLYAGLSLVLAFAAVAGGKYLANILV